MLDTHNSLAADPKGRFSRVLAGGLLAACVVTGAIASLTSWLPTLLGGLLAWAAGFILWSEVPKRTRVQSAILLTVGGLGLLVGFVAGGSLAWRTAIAGNANLIAMLAAVSFLRLITAPSNAEPVVSEYGRRSLLATIVGVHLFGAVVNLSTVFIMARRMSDGDTLSRQQYVALVRGFGSAAFWSPFFAAMAAALTYAPGAQLSSLLAFGLPLAVIALALTYRDVNALGVQHFRGYPMNFASLWLPGLLAALILGAHWWRPALSVLGLIAALAPSVTILTLALRRQPVGRQLAHHMREGLPGMRAELVLFLAAGVMAAGLMSLVAVTGVSLPFDGFGAWQASALLTGLVGLSIVGVHPVIGVAAAAPLVAPLDPDPSLLASCFLAAWGIGVAASPLSAMNLALQGAYRLRAGDSLRWNLPFAAAMLVAAALLFLLHPGA